MQITAEKEALRQKIRGLQKSLPEGYLSKAGAGIARRIISCPEYQEARTVMAFVSTSEEADLRPFLRKVLDDQKRLAVPLCTAPGIMEARLIRGLEQLAPGRYGILEPVPESARLEPNEIDLIIVPCMTCTPRGERLGHGGGYYDRYLALYRGPAVLVCPDLLLQAHMPAETHDRRIPIVITEAATYRPGPVQPPPVMRGMAERGE